jgi:hypothetical protein
MPRDHSEADFVSLVSRARLDTDLWVVAWDGDEVAGVLQNWIWPEENRTLGIARAGSSTSASVVVGAGVDSAGRSPRKDSVDCAPPG